MWSWSWIKTCCSQSVENDTAASAAKLIDFSCLHFVKNYDLIFFGQRLAYFLLVSWGDVFNFWSSPPFDLQDLKFEAFKITSIFFGLLQDKNALHSWCLDYKREKQNLDKGILYKLRILKTGIQRKAFHCAQQLMGHSSKLQYKRKR